MVLSSREVFNCMYTAARRCAGNPQTRLIIQAGLELLKWKLITKDQ